MPKKRRTSQSTQYTTYQRSLQEAATWIRQAQIEAPTPAATEHLGKIGRNLKKLHDQKTTR